MNKENIVVIIMGALVIILGGLLIYNLGVKQGKSGQPPQQQAALPPGSGSPMDYQQRIAEAEKIVARDPSNLQAWIQLGNDYFDSDQSQKAIDAYGKALQLKPDDPNVLTDQGVMYRKVGMFDKAVANFEKASKIDPNHEQSLVNLGVVYAEDLKKPEKALEVWSRYLQLHPLSPSAQQVKMWVDKLKAPQGAPTKSFGR